MGGALRTVQADEIVVVPDSLQIPNVEVSPGSTSGTVSGTIQVQNTGLRALPGTVQVKFFIAKSGPAVAGQSPVSAIVSAPCLIQPGETVALSFQVELPSVTELGTDAYEAVARVWSGEVLTTQSIATQMARFTVVPASLVQYFSDAISTTHTGLVKAGEARQFTHVPGPLASATRIALGHSGSNLHLHVYDDQDRHVGMNYQTGELEIEIPARYLPAVPKNTSLFSFLK